MKKTAKAKAIIKLLKQGYSPREITQRMDASYNYAWTLQKELATEKAAAKAAKIAVKAEVENDDDVVRPRLVGPHKAMRVTKAEQEAIKAKAGEYMSPLKSKAETEGVGAILNTRASNYGTFLDNARITQRLKAVAHNFAGQNNKTFDADQAEALDMIFTKIGRILNGDSNHIDSWLDIAGYATLVADRLQGKVR